MIGIGSSLTVVAALVDWVILFSMISLDEISKDCAIGINKKTSEVMAFLYPKVG
jgi:hypothetical protein